MFHYRSSGAAAGAKWSRWFTLMLCAMTAGGGGAALWRGYTEWRASREHRWETAEGRVSRSWVQVNRGRAPSVKASAYCKEACEIRINYTFRVNDAVKAGSDLAPRQLVDEEGETAAQAIADSYPPGSSIRVYYRAENPGINNLRQVKAIHHRGNLLFLWGGLAFAIGACGIALVCVRRKSEK